MTNSSPPIALLQQMLDARSAEAAAAALMERPEWRTGPPPPEVMAAVGDPSRPHDGATLELARAWERGAMTAALFDALDTEADVERRRRLAWVMKQTPDLAAVPALLARAESASDDRVVRRYLLEAITPLAWNDVPWPVVEKTVLLLARDPDPLVREGAVALAGMGRDCKAERVAVQLAALADPDETIVAVAAHMLKGKDVHVESAIPPALLDRLLRHPNPSVRLAVRDLVVAPPLR
jgi:hypothetical protein